MVQKDALIFLRYQDPASPMQKTGLTLYFYPSFLDWYHLFCKSVSLLDVITRAQSTIIFLCVRHFWHGGEHQTNQVILEQACSWPVRIQSFAIRMYQRKYSYNAFTKGKLMCKKDCSGSSNVLDSLCIYWKMRTWSVTNYFLLNFTSLSEETNHWIIDSIRGISWAPRMWKP